MIIKNKFDLLRTCCLFGFLTIGLAGCSEKITNDSANGNITIQMSAMLSNIEMSQLISRFILTVNAEDFTAPVVAQLQLEGSFLVGEVIIPAGANRHFLVQALDAPGTVIYEGDTYADVIYDDTVDVDINLFPIVPLMKIIPRFSSIAMGTPFTADIYLYNTPDVRSITFDLNYSNKDTLVNIVNLSSMQKGTTLPVDCYLSYEGSYSTATVWIDFFNASGTLVDSAGYAHLATFYFSSHSDTNRDYDTASLVITPVILDRSVGDVSNPFPLDSLYLEEAMFELYRDGGAR